MQKIAMTREEKWFVRHLKSDNFKTEIQTKDLLNDFLYNGIDGGGSVTTKRSSFTVLGMFLRKYCPKSQKKKVQRDFTHKTYYIFPERSQCLKDFYEKFNEIKRYEEVIEKKVEKKKCPLCNSGLARHVSNKIYKDMNIE